MLFYHSTLILVITILLERTVQTCKLHFPHPLEPVPVRRALPKTSSLPNLMINPFLLNSSQYLTWVITPSYLKHSLRVTSRMPQPLISFLHNSSLYQPPLLHLLLCLHSISWCPWGLSLSSHVYSPTNRLHSNDFQIFTISPHLPLHTLYFLSNSISPPDL